MSKKLADIVNKLRKKKNFSQEQLSIRSGIDRTYISHLLNGRRRFNEDIIFKLANALDVHPSVFFPERKSGKPLQSDELSEKHLKKLVQELQVEFCASGPLTIKKIKDALRAGLEVHQRVKGERSKQSKKRRKPKRKK